MTFLIRTYGCQMNERDSETIAAALIRSGWEPADGEMDADLILVNTCSVRAKAEDKALGKLGLLTASKRGPPDRIVGAVGCMVQRLQATIFDRVPGLRFAVGPGAMWRLPDIIFRAVAGERHILDVSDSPAETSVMEGCTPLAGPVRAFVNILKGCNRRCTYCIVPTVRGPEWSRPASWVLEEIRGRVAAGARDVTLLGQSVMSYGRTGDPWSGEPESPGGYREPFSRLIEAAGLVPDLRRLRFTSGHPSGCTAELARVMSRTPAVCEHLHLPLQSGSDPILQRMGRGYTVADYREAVRLLREAVPALTLGTDIIVGFPGETESDFSATRQLMDEIGFDSAFIFKYSPRPGTWAAEWEDDVTADDKMSRNQVLLDDQNRRTLAAHRAMIGTSVEVLVDGESPRDPTRWTGRTRTNHIVIFHPAPGIEPGDLRMVDIRRATSQAVYGMPRKAT